MCTRSARGWRNTTSATATRSGSSRSACWPTCRRRTWAHAPIDPAILRAARAEIAALNARWGSRFYLFTRPRVQTPDGKWSAWERKRGALLELARLVLDRPGTLQCAAGDAAA